MVFVGTRFSIGLLMQPGKSSRTTGQLSGSIFPAALVVRWKNAAFPQAGTKNDGCGQKSKVEEIFQGLDRFE
jgi:hypothetical protein